MSSAAHWERAYGAKPATQVSWYAPHLGRSLALIRGVAEPSAEIIDVGGGASTLVDDLLSAGYARLTVLDISGAALAIARQRLGPRADEVRWIVSDVTKADLPEARYDVWHDRAVFHFLMEADERRAYAERATRSLRPGGHLILAAFSLQGPARCSGLDVVRYSGESLGRELGPAFALQHEAEETHLTPAGQPQKFVYGLFVRAS